jgi:hypothetical protein
MKSPHLALVAVLAISLVGHPTPVRAQDGGRIAILGVGGNMVGTQRRSVLSDVRDAASRALSGTNWRVQTADEAAVALMGAGEDDTKCSKGPCGPEMLPILGAAVGIQAEVMFVAPDYYITVKVLRAGSSAPPTVADGRATQATLRR